MLRTGSARRTRWRVAWLAKGRVVSKAFGDDYPAALELFVKAKAAGKTGATLICANVAFEPPPSLRPRRVSKVKREIVVVRGKRRVKKEVITGIISPLKRLNSRGIWWCPYCIKLRKFERKDGFWSGNQWISEPGYHCPICTISHRDFGVRKWNPVAARIYAQPGRLPGRDGIRRRKRR